MGPGGGGAEVGGGVAGRGWDSSRRCPVFGAGSAARGIRRSHKRVFIFRERRLAGWLERESKMKSEEYANDLAIFVW